MAAAWKALAIDKLGSSIDLTTGDFTVSVTFTDGDKVATKVYTVGSQEALDRMVNDRVDMLNAAAKLADTVSLPESRATLSKDQAAALHAVIDQTKKDWENADLVNSTMVANPQPQGTVPRPDDHDWAVGVFDALSESFHKTWWGYPTIAKFVHALQFASLRPTLSFFLISGTKGGVLSPDDAQILTDARDSQVPNPAWPSEVTQAAAILGRDCTATDIASAR